jgi:hypothetical protein
LIANRAIAMFVLRCLEAEIRAWRSEISYLVRKENYIIGEKEQMAGAVPSPREGKRGMNESAG